MVMKKLFPAMMLLFSGLAVNAQISKDNLLLNQDSLLKEKLVQLAMQNPEINIATANINIAEYDLRKSKSAWLGALSATGNANEFVITNKNEASFFPKYNFGVSIPFDIFSKARNAKKVAEQNLVIGYNMKKSKEQMIRAEVLTRFENYREKKELMRLQKIYMDANYQDYLAAQTSVANGSMKLDEMNRIYQAYVNEQSKLVTKERDYNVSVIQLEEIIGVPLSVAMR